jgi:hypothetical protein
MSAIVVTVELRLKPYQKLQRHWTATGGHMKTTNRTEREIVAPAEKAR